MSDKSYLEWPFFDDAHRALAAALEDWAVAGLGNVAHDGHVDDSCRTLVKALGKGGWLRYAVPKSHGGQLEQLDSRSLCLIRETLARHDGLADFAFAMQGLGSGAISLAGSDEIKRRYLPRVASGEAIAAFALSEPDAGSDVAALSTGAELRGDHYVLNGQKTWISNGGIADF
ncbi:MAG: acyl-CoA dehydrogenase family protein, partial [Proteobacteria bacterium]|nr:acyl-CoA dehydrogenase family protein [Pseudomonadota bacterium]